MNSTNKSKEIEKMIQTITIKENAVLIGFSIICIVLIILQFFNFHVLQCGFVLAGTLLVITAFKMISSKRSALIRRIIDDNQIEVNVLTNQLIEKDAQIHTLIRNHTEEVEQMEESALAVIKKIKPKIDLLPVYSNQINAVIQLTDEAASSLIDSFRVINKKTKEHTQITEQSFNKHNADGADSNIFEYNKQFLATLMKNFNDITGKLNEMFSGISYITGNLGNIGDVFLKIQEFQQKTQVLSLNAGIVAARAGEHGKAFSIISREIKGLSEKIDGSLIEINGLIKNTIHHSTTILSNIESSVQENIDISDNAEKRINEMLTLMDMQISSMSEGFENFKAMTEHISKSIGQIVVSIQFQDITRQRLEHVITPLNDLYEELSGSYSSISKKESVNSVSDKGNVEAWMNSMYTMEHEREIMKKVLGN